MLTPVRETDSLGQPCGPTVTQVREYREEEEPGERQECRAVHEGVRVRLVGLEGG